MGRRLDLVDTLIMQGHSCSQNDRHADQIGKGHADIGIETNSAKLGGGLFGMTTQIMIERRGIELLDLLRTLPKEHIGADGRAKDRHHHDQGVTVPGQVRPDRAGGDLEPRHLHRHHHRDIGKERQGQPLQNAHIAVIGHQDL